MGRLVDLDDLVSSRIAVARLRPTPGGTMAGGDYHREHADRFI